MEIGRQGNVDDSRKAFGLALKTNFQNEEVLILKEEYQGPTFSTAVLVDISKDKLYDVVEKLRSIDVVDVIEPEVHEVNNE